MQHPGADLRLVEAQMHHRVVDRAGELQRPESGALRVDRDGVSGRRG
jgi:hypothetical protein